MSLPNTIANLFAGILLLLLFTNTTLVHAHKLNPKVIKALTGEEISYDHHSIEETEGDPRNHDRTFYSFPEWYIVYSAQEYGEFVTNGGRPSQFPFFTAIGQAWESWELSESVAESEPDGTTKTILWTISLSFSAEHGLAGVYEKTIGRLFEWSHFGFKTTEDRYIDSQAKRYGEFLNQTPWYQFPYFHTLGGLWKTYGWSSISPRGIERRLVYTIGYTAKGLYAGVIRLASSTSFGGAALTTQVVAIVPPAAQATLTASSTQIAAEQNLLLLDLPRYRALLPELEQLAEGGATFVSIQGHDTIAFSVVTTPNQSCISNNQYLIFQIPFATDTSKVRYLLHVPITTLHSQLRTLNACGIPVEHIYDY